MSPGAPIAGQGLAVRRIRLPRREVAWLRALLEARDGLALLYGDGSGAILIVAPADRELELDELLEDLQSELGFQKL